MTGPDADFERVYLKPAELCFSRVPTLVTTILGSCVAVTMRHPKLGLAAICHALQAVCPKLSTECPQHCEKKYQYVTCVIPEMVHLLEDAGADREMLEVKLFGGAAVLRTVADQPIGQSIGRLNIEAADSILARYGFNLKVHQVGGTYGRKIIFNTYSGEVKVKRIRYAESLRVLTTGK